MVALNLTTFKVKNSPLFPAMKVSLLATYAYVYTHEGESLA